MLFFSDKSAGCYAQKKSRRLNRQTYLDKFVWNDILREFRALPKERRDEILYFIYQKIALASIRERFAGTAQK